MLEPWALGHKRLKKMVAWRVYQKLMLNLACALHATSPREAANLRKLGLKPRIEMIPWGIALEGTSNIEYRSKEERAENRSVYTDSPTGQRHCNPATPNYRTALFVGRIYPVKGLPMLVEAWEKLRPEGWKMKIVGPDEAGHLAEVERLILEAGLVGKFEFSGPLTGSALNQAYNNADLYIQPSHTENFGMAIAEAMAHALPVITTQGAPWKLLEEEHCGWWTPISTDGIAVALDDATRRSPENLAGMGQRARAIVGERFAWEAIARQFVDCYQWLRSEGPKPARVAL
jgi:glycosyltransferase involved in cell wall biosynthesis